MRWLWLLLLFIIVGYGVLGQIGQTVAQSVIEKQAPLSPKAQTAICTSVSNCAITPEYSIALGNYANVESNYSIVLGDWITAKGDECQIKLGTIGPEIKKLLRAKYHSGRRLHFLAGTEIENHCNYKPGTVDNLINFALAK